MYENLVVVAKMRVCVTLFGVVCATIGCEKTEFPTGSGSKLIRSIEFGENVSLALNTGNTQVSVRQQQTRDDELFADDGLFFKDKVNTQPQQYSLTAVLCTDCWAIAEIRSRNGFATLSDFLSIVPDPSKPDETVLQLRSPEHTDGVILRSLYPLPENYEISFRIGHLKFGGDAESNGYDLGTETGEPWMDIPAKNHNGVYWAAIMDTRPSPHNNVWSHHHRKFFIDSWNTPGRLFGVTVAGVQGLSSTDSRFGKSFLAFDGVSWLGGSTKPAFYYLPDEWYSVIVRRDRDNFHFSVEGTFGGIGASRIASSIDARKSCLYHFNRSSEELTERCKNGEVIQVAGTLHQTWPADRGYPDFFMMGDPHVNFYEGSVLIDDLSLKTL